MKAQPSIAYLIEPRFPGGTSSAIASELKVAAQLGRTSVHAVSSQMFKGQQIAPQIRNILQELGLELIWDAPTISADLVFIHNPSFLKFETTLSTRIIAKHLIVVAHENFLRPAKARAFDVAKCLNLIDNASLALRKSIAPISPYNRETICDWFNTNQTGGKWSVLADDWFNICDFVMHPPTNTPADRRGRLSRPGMEKFPTLAEMDLCFPAHAQSNVILGADLFMTENLKRTHWDMIPFRGVEVDQFFEMIDFVVYFNCATLRESFGRILAEGIAAGKVVISDPQTASVFQGAVIGTTPGDVDSIIKKFVANPDQYRDQVKKGQDVLKIFSPEKFQLMLKSISDQKIGH